MRRYIFVLVSLHAQTARDSVVHRPSDCIFPSASSDLPTGAPLICNGDGMPVWTFNKIPSAQLEDVRLARSSLLLLF